MHDDMMNMQDPVTIGAHCILQVRNRFFLVVEIEVEAGNVEFEEFVFIRITRQEAMALLNSGVPRCEISRRIPRSDELDVEFICVLIVGGMAFALFDVENDFDEAVFVRISLIEAQRLLRKGAKRCTIIDRLQG
ncbi:hypothetical protein ACNQFZ_13150 [Schinkia sp. CFF1]